MCACCFATSLFLHWSSEVMDASKANKKHQHEKAYIIASVAPLEGPFLKSQQERAYLHLEHAHPSLVAAFRRAEYSHTEASQDSQAPVGAFPKETMQAKEATRSISAAGPNCVSSTHVHYTQLLNQIRSMLHVRHREENELLPYLCSLLLLVAWT